MSAKWSVQSVKGTVADADVLLIIDSEAGPVDSKQILFSTLALAAQTPWRVEIDAVGFALRNFGFIESNASAVPLIGAIRLGDLESIVWRNSTNDGDFDITSNDPTITFNGWQTIEFPNADLVDFATPVTITGVDSLEFNGGGTLEMGDTPIASVASIQSTFSNRTDLVLNLGNTEIISWEKATPANGAIALTVDASDNFLIRVSPSSIGAFVTEYSFSPTQADFNGNFIRNAPQIQDAAGLEVLKFVGIGSAVNEVTLQNAATLNDPQLQASGDDTDIGIKLVPKGTGEVIGNIETLLLPLGDEITPPSTGIKYTFFAVHAGKFVGAGFAQATVAPTTSALILDILKNGVSIFSTKPEVAAAANDGNNGVLTTDPLDFAAGDKIELSVDTLDSGGTGAGAKVGVLFYYT